MRVPLIILALGCGLILPACGGGEWPLSGPDLNVEGDYPVQWRVIYYEVVNPQPASQRPSFRVEGCSGTVTIWRHSGDDRKGSVEGTITTSEGSDPRCRVSQFPLSATVYRNAGGVGSDSWDYGWELWMDSDIEPFLGCTFTSMAPGNTGPQRGVGDVRPDGSIRLIWLNIYACPDGAWRVLAVAETEGAG